MKHPQLVLFVLASLTSPLFAQTAATRIAEGKTLLLDDDFAGADVKFQQALSLSPNLNEAIFWRQATRLATLTQQPEFAALAASLGVSNFVGDPANFNGEFTYATDPAQIWTVVTANTFDGVDALLSPVVDEDLDEASLNLRVLPDRSYRLQARMANPVGTNFPYLQVFGASVMPGFPDPIENEVFLAYSPLSSTEWTEISFSTAGLVPAAGETTIVLSIDVGADLPFPGNSFRCLIDKLEATSGSALPAPAAGTLGAAIDFDTPVEFPELDFPQPGGTFSFQQAVDYAKNTLLPAVRTARTELERITTPGVIATLTETDPFGGEDTTTFDLADVTLFQSGLLGAEAFLHYLSSKNWSVMARALHDAQANGTLNVEQFMALNPQLLANVASTTDAATAKDRVLSFISRYLAANNLVASRAVGQEAFFTLDSPDDQQTNADFIADLLRIQQSINAPLFVAEAEEQIFLGPLFGNTFNPNSFLPRFSGDEIIEESIQDTTYGGVLEKTKRGEILSVLREDDSVVSDGSLDQSFTAWVDTKFTVGEKATPTISGPNADPDGDGLTNLQEYAFSSDPKIKTSRNSPIAELRSPEFGFGSQEFAVEYIRPTYLPVGVTYRVEGATSPAGPWLPLVNGVDYYEEVDDVGFSQVIKAVRPALAGNQFMRIVAVVE